MMSGFKLARQDDMDRDCSSHPAVCLISGAGFGVHLYSDGVRTISIRCGWPSVWQLWLEIRPANGSRGSDCVPQWLLRTVQRHGQCPTIHPTLGSPAHFLPAAVSAGVGCVAAAIVAHAPRTSLQQCCNTRLSFCDRLLRILASLCRLAPAHGIQIKLEAVWVCRAAGLFLCQSFMIHDGT